MGTLERLRRIQIGKETVKGTSVASTAQLLANSFDTPLAPEIYYPEQQLGLLAEQHAGVQVNTVVDHTWETECTFEQILYALLAGMKGGVTPTGAGADKTWTFDPSATGASDFDAFTIEKRFSDGTTNYDREYPYSLVKSIKLTGEVNGIVKMTVEWLSQKEDTSTMTAAIAAPTAWEIPVTNLGKVYIDTTWAGLGTTQVSGQIHSFEWTFMTGIDRRFYMDGNLYFSRHSRMKREAELKLKMDVSTQSEALRPLVTSRAKRYVRVSLLGSVVGSGVKTINLDGAYVIDPIGAEDTRDGDDAVEITGKSRYDTTGAQDVKVIVINSLAALP